MATAKGKHDGLQVVREGDFVYIATDVPHLPYNRSDTEPVMAVIARTDPNEQESVVLLPELEDGVDWAAQRGAP